MENINLYLVIFDTSTSTNENSILDYSILESSSDN